MITIPGSIFKRANGKLLRLCWAVLLCLVPSAVRAQSFTTVHHFDAYPDGVGLSASLVSSADGSCYGITGAGGAHGFGNVFHVTPGGEFAALYSFNGVNDGGSPTLLTSGKNGVFYGATTGALFKITPAGTLTLLTHFDAGSTGALTSLIQGRDSRLYGATTRAGVASDGTLFRVNADGSQFTTLYSFTGSSDGATPDSLIQGQDGRLYGLAQNGGGNQNGTLFRIDANGSHFAVLHSFSFLTDGAGPQDLIQGPDGALYGALALSGVSSGGALFRIETDGSGFSLLHGFSVGSEGAIPHGLAFGSNGALFGVTMFGGVFGVGTLFQSATNGSSFSVLHTFTGGDDGATPQGLTLGANDSLYGTASGGGDGRGVIFKATSTGTVTPVCILAGSADGADAQDITLGWDGNLYGVTSSGGLYNRGSIFRQAPGGDITTLYSFTGGSDGSAPTSAPILGLDGNLYGTVSSGGRFGQGEVYRLNRLGNLLVIHSFSTATFYAQDLLLHNHDGLDPNGLAQTSDGMLYGTTFDGGAKGYGTLFSLNPKNRQYTVLYTFTNEGDQGSPAGPLIVGQDGNLYGTASGIYSAGGYGSLFQLTPQGALATLITFTYPDRAANPVGALVQGPDGTLYGVCALTGNNGAGFGSIFSAAPDGSAFTRLHTFTGGADGRITSGGVQPYQNHYLALNTDGTLYGIASAGGTTGNGTLYRLHINGSAFKVKNSFDGEDQGALPTGLVATGNGTLYGVTDTGGEYNQGTLFQFGP